MQDYNKTSVICALGSYVLWGLLPIYWKSLSIVPAYEILANRIIWSLGFVILLMVMTGKWYELIGEVKQVVRDRKKMLGVLIAGVLVSLNWGIFIWAVNSGRLVETSMGYYINPLVSILIGVIYLKEKLNLLSKLAVALAAVGVAVMMQALGFFPWVSLSLAVSFAFYGLVKKLLPVSTQVGLILETAVVLVPALGYVIHLSRHGIAAWQVVEFSTLCLLIGAGAVTAVPLLLFTRAAKELPLYMVGFLQYIAPTLSLLLGIFYYDESFTWQHLQAFIWIWVGLIIFTWSQFRRS